MAVAFDSPNSSVQCYLGLPISVDLLCVTADGKHAYGYCTRTNLFQHMDLTNGKKTGIKTEMRPNINGGKELNSACKALLHCSQSSKTYIITVIREQETGKCFLVSYHMEDNVKADFVDQHFIGFADTVQIPYVKKYFISHDEQGNCYFVQRGMKTNEDNTEVHQSISVTKFVVDDNGCFSSNLLLQHINLDIKDYKYHFVYAGHFYYLYNHNSDCLRKIDLQVETSNSKIQLKTNMHQWPALSNTFSSWANVDDIYFCFDVDQTNASKCIVYFDLTRNYWNTLDIGWYQEDHMIQCSSLHSDQKGRLFLIGPCKNLVCSNTARTHLYIIDVNSLRRKISNESNKLEFDIESPSRRQSRVICSEFAKFRFNKIAFQFVPVEYEKQEKLGTGGFGVVHKCFDVKLHRFFVIKEIIWHNEEDLKIGKEEAEKLHTLSHPRIIDYYDSKIELNKIIIFMEYMAAGSLFQVIKKHGAVKEEVAKTYIEQVLEGLAYVHSKGIIHSDLKCDNLLLDGQGGVKLGDFGIAIRKLLNTSNNSLFTHTAKGGGTLYWMAHELLRDENVGGSRRTDIWSLGCTIVEMLTGKPPHSQLSGPMFNGAVYNNSLIYDPEELTPTASSAMKQFLICLLQIDPMERPHTAADATEKFKMIFN